MATEWSDESRRLLPLPAETHLVTSSSSPGLLLLRNSLTDASLVALDAEWKPHHLSRQPSSSSSSSSSDAPSSFPTVTLLQIACRSRSASPSRVFVVDLLSVPHADLWEMLSEMFVSPAVLKLGFRFKQDLVYLSSTFSSHGFPSGFDRVEPFLDITTVYHLIKTNQPLKKIPKESKSLATICKEVLGVSLAKELQCSDWSCRPLTEEQIAYAAADAYYLVELFDAFQRKVTNQGPLYEAREATECYSSDRNDGLEEIFRKSRFMSSVCDDVLSRKFCVASSMVKSGGSEILSVNQHVVTCGNSLQFDHSLSKIIEMHGDRIMLKESDRKPKMSRKKERKRCSRGPSCLENALIYDWVGPPPWDLTIGGDGCPKFLCDVMVEGLAKHLRCVGIDAAISSSRRPEARELLTQTQKEKRVLLTRDTKLLKHMYLIENQVYKVKSLLKNEQLLEVIEVFQLKISEDQLMSRCTKCNGRFIQKPLTIEEAIEAAKGFQVIPNCLFKKDLEFWQCTDCRQLYWEGTQYHNAVQKFIDVCKLKL